jgi:hypothetical protein
MYEINVICDVMCVQIVIWKLVVNLVIES